MKKFSILFISILLLTGCGGDDSSTNEVDHSQHQAAGHVVDNSAPPFIIKDGKYSDKRFIDMMVPHHEMAVVMAEEALTESDNPEIKEFANRIIRSQTNEIEELKRIRAEIYGSRTTPKGMHPTAMELMGMDMQGFNPSDSNSEGHHNEEAEHEHDTPVADEHGHTNALASDYDKYFLDNMIPHHSAAINHASLVLMHSDNYKLKVIAREIIDEQSREIGMMGEWRLAWWHHEF